MRRRKVVLRLRASFLLATSTFGKVCLRVHNDWAVKNSKLRARLYLVAGWISVALGIIGIPTPLLPTTPFLLLAAFCFARGSQRLARLVG
jgi:hypothetical protein